MIDPVTLFGHYVYRSSISQGYKDHCRKMAEELMYQYGLTQDSFHIDIAGNDGALLNEFNHVIGCRVLNIDPAENMVEICEAKGIRQFSVFWGIKAAKHLISTEWPKADLITATNVFAHVDDVNEFIQATEMVLKPTGVLILEFPYLIDFIERGEFDTIYFEHLSYFGIGPIVKLCAGTGLRVMKVEKQDIHGGSVRVHIGYGEPDDSVRQFVLKEYRYRDITLYYDFAAKAKKTIDLFKALVSSIVNNGATVAGFAASAKGNTLLNCAGITNEISYIVDETPEKIGKYSPGTHIPIVSMERLKSNPPDYLVILSWNFAEAIKQKCIESGYTGGFIVPVI